MLCRLTHYAGIFGPYLKSFYVRSTDPTHVRVLKLEVLTNLASETNISVILREFQTYVRSSDKRFVAHTIQGIARCATNITEVTDTCLSGLVSLLSNRDGELVSFLPDYSRLYTDPDLLLKKIMVLVYPFNMYPSQLTVSELVEDICG
ncbi:unnamed protein product [Clavelina lepadiformis]|uniref:Clathrin/coatomer adaptor adaptin-like N-terminal domain-containing protein n=1 Tax=Clavelina lepadiformis TaxID=159417 RepID=A0ABP0FIE0_CLALP